MDPKTILLSILFGVTPALVWLWFWFKEDNITSKSKGLVLFTFILGAIGVVVVLPLEKFAKSIISDKNQLTVVWAALEEIVKYLAVAAVALKSRFIEEPIDYVMYFITAALGFAALENVLFLNQPGNLDQAMVNLLTGNLRFLGATLLHTVSSGIVGVLMALNSNKNAFFNKIYLLIGLAGAVTLHSIFNFFIIKDGGQDFLRIFGFLWVVTIIFILILEKIRRIGPYYKTNA